MKEHEADTVPYWQVDVEVGEASFQGRPIPVYLRIHESHERYSHRTDLIPLLHPHGTRAYIHARPHILIPHITLTAELFATPAPDGAMGEVVASHWGGMRSQEIGNAQAWYYPTDHLFILWECYLFEGCRKDIPAQDPTLTLLWTGFERVLLENAPEVQRIVTPAWEPIYDTPLWQEFLSAQGYQPLDNRAFVKDVVTP
jgi:hypothetical protein